MSGALDSLANSPLVLGTNAGPGFAQNLGAVTHVFCQSCYIFVVRRGLTFAKGAIYGNRLFLNNSSSFFGVLFCHG